MVYDFYLNRMPVMMGPQAGVTVAHVDDIADGHLLAMEKGRSGESYILAGPAMTYKQMMEMWQCHLRHSGAQALAAGLDGGAQFPTRRRIGAGLQAENGALV